MPDTLSRLQVRSVPVDSPPSIVSKWRGLRELGGQQVVVLPGLGAGHEERGRAPELLLPVTRF